MTLNDYLQKLGNIFFRWRSYIPLLLLSIIFLKLKSIQFVFGNRIIETAYQAICMLISFLGEAIRIWVIGYAPLGTSGRNTKVQRATSLNTKGIYSLTRNPLYFGNYLIILGISLFTHSWEIVALNSILFVMFYVPIILVEEGFLADKFGEKYQKYVSRTPCFFPRFSKWSPTDGNWSWKMVIRREHNSIFAIAISFTTIAHLRLYLINSRATSSVPWLIFIGVLTPLWLIARALKLTKKL